MKKIIINSAGKFLWRNKYTLLMFFLILFRPHIMKAIRHSVLPYENKSSVHKKFERAQTKKRGHSMKIRKASFVFLSVDEDDGCSDDEGCDSEEDSEYYDGGSASDDGCSDDEGCETEADGGYSGDDTSDDGCSDDDDGCESSSSYEYNDYEDDSCDDGCSCGGETVTGGGNSFFNPNLRVQFTLSQASGVQVTVKDNYDLTLATLVNSSWLSANFHSYLWDGSYGGNHFITHGSYTAVLRLSRGHYVYNVSGAFTYNNIHGFQVNGSSGYVIDFGTLN